MDITRSTSDAAPSGAPRRVLIAVHGHEPPRWETQVRLTLTSLPLAAFQVLGAIDSPNSAFTSLVAPARRAHAAATRAWRRLGEERVCQRLGTLLSVLPPGTAVTCIRTTVGDPGRTIAGLAATWDADLVVVGLDARPWLERRLLGAIHERVVAHARCDVLIIPARRTAAYPSAGPARVPPGSTPFGEHRPLAAGGEA